MNICKVVKEEKKVPTSLRIHLLFSRSKSSVTVMAFDCRLLLRS